MILSVPLLASSLVLFAALAVDDPAPSESEAHVAILLMPVDPDCECVTTEKAKDTANTSYTCPPAGDPPVSPGAGVTIHWDTPVYRKGECNDDVVECETKTKDCKIDFDSNVEVQIGNCVTTAYVEATGYYNGGRNAIIISTEYDLDVDVECYDGPSGGSQDGAADIRVYLVPTGGTPVAKLYFKITCHACTAVGGVPE